MNRLSQVDPRVATVQAARALGISFGDCPADESPFARVRASGQGLESLLDVAEAAAEEVLAV